MAERLRAQTKSQTKSAIGFEFRILCLEGSVISSSHHSQEVLIVHFSLYVNN